MILPGKTRSEVHSLQWPAVIAVICPQVIKTMWLFCELRPYCNMVQLQEGRLSVLKLSELDSRTIDSFLSLLLLVNTPGNLDTILMLWMERQFRAFKKSGVEFAEKERVEAEVSIG